MSIETINLDTLTGRDLLIREQTLIEERDRVIDLVVRQAYSRGWCAAAVDALNAVYGDPGPAGWQDSEGRDFQGRDLDGYDRDGYDRGGFDRDGYSRQGWHRDTGKNREGVRHHSYPTSIPEGAHVTWCDSCECFEV